MLVPAVAIFETDTLQQVGQTLKTAVCHWLQHYLEPVVVMWWTVRGRTKPPSARFREGCVRGNESPSSMILLHSNNSSEINIIVKLILIIWWGCPLGGGPMVNTLIVIMVAWLLGNIIAIINMIINFQVMNCLTTLNLSFLLSFSWLQFKQDERDLPFLIFSQLIVYWHYRMMSYWAIFSFQTRPITIFFSPEPVVNLADPLPKGRTIGKISSTMEMSK